MIISKKRIISLDFLDKYKTDNAKIGIHVTNKEYEKLGIKEFIEGTTIQPSPELGINCNRNSNGYSFPDKTKPMEERIINTIYWTWQDWGGNEHGDFFDISRKVYPRVEIPASNIELLLTKNNSGESFILANIDLKVEKGVIKRTINMFLEIFGFCEIFNKDLDLIDVHNKIKRCNWELLPPGVRAIALTNINKEKENEKQKRLDYNQLRLDTLNSYNPSEIFVGTGGFTGYFAFVFKNTCFLENGYYGNATYVVPKDKWKELSQLSKQEVLSTPDVIDKVIHTRDWFNKINILMNKHEN